MIDRGALTERAFSWNRALAMALSCQLAYRTTATRVATSVWGFDACSLLGDAGQGFVCWDSESVVATFAGPSRLGRWLGNVQLDAVPYDFGGVLHEIHVRFEAVRQPFERALAESGAAEKALWLTGHGVGGALAALATATLPRPASISGLYTFGQPRLFDPAAAEALRSRFASSCIRFVNEDDPIPIVPPGYEHVGTRIRFDRHGRVTQEDETRDSSSKPALDEVRETIHRIEGSLREREAEASLWQRVEGAVRARKSEESLLRSVVGALFGSGSDEGLWRTLEASLEGLIPGVHDHGIDAYLRHVRQQAPQRAKIDFRFESAPATRQRPADPTVESAPVESEAAIPVLVRVKDPHWVAPEGLAVQSRLGSVFSVSASPRQIEALRDDDGVMSIDVSRDGGVFELDSSLPFLRAVDVHRPPISERGNACVVGVIDSGVDVLHEAFSDAAGATRIEFVWNQRDRTGPSPHAIDPASFPQTYGTLHVRADLDAMITVDQAPSDLRDPDGHGTHVASIAAGRAVGGPGGFAGGLAPEARIVAVIPNMDTRPGDPPSLGYSNSHVDALAFTRAAAGKLGLPVVVNVSLGMNAGAHDGSSTLEAAFDGFTGMGRDPGVVVVKSAGNERTHHGHARAQVALNTVSTISWKSSGVRFEDYIEVWYGSFDSIQFTLEDPAGSPGSPQVSPAQPEASFQLDGNECRMRLSENHPDNGDNLLTVRILAGSRPIQTGTWKLHLLGLDVDGSGVVHAWVERDRSRAVTFERGDDDMTLSIPGTAEHVIAVAACESSLPVRLTESSSFGLTRDGRPKPEICAPGLAIRAAAANTADHSATVAKTGTSMAAPHVAGSIALVLSKRHKNGPQVNANQIRAALNKSTKTFTGVHHRGAGFGALDTLDFFNRF